MNETLETLLNHRSIRSFKDKTLTQEELDIILEAASYASTSSYLMAYSIIGVTDQDKKAQLASISNQPYIEKNGHFLLFCADFHRHIRNTSAEEYENMRVNLENTEHFLVATIDATLAAQNAAIAAESMGLGICYIGSIRNDIDKVDALFQLPEHVVPLFGMAIGYPDAQPDQKPRLAKPAFYFENQYISTNDEANYLQKFDEKISDYYQNRTTNQRNDSWTDQMKHALSTPKRARISTYVKEKGFNKR
ncbi:MULTISPECIES: oxygen-insensitive NADPH nitroreductase [Paraliobacillus]|uniref:oxygen-insensitive NADPH nitroreductase n=1 Tax=Paraliobacillus TaxID=200903 RepID=UPI000DD43FD2|nr:MULTISPECIES: oxygen-insensitive NADPH nitroreductase [Paraliobacillus]